MEKLLEYKMYKFMSYELREREEEAAGAMYRKEDIPAEVKAHREPVDLDRLLDGISLIRLNEIFQMVMKKQEDKIDPVRSKFGRIQKEPVKIEDKILDVLSMCRDRQEFSFDALFTGRADRYEIVVAFLAVLELMKVGAVRLTQETLFGDIRIQAAETEDALKRLELEYS